VSESGHGFDVFLSYNGRDRAAATAIAEKLKREDLRPWIDVWESTPGVLFHTELLAGLDASSACAVLVGPDQLGDWGREELGVALNRAAKEPSFHLFAVLLPGLTPEFDPSELPAFLATRGCIDLRSGIASQPGWRAFVRAIHGKPPGPPTGQPRASHVPDSTLLLERLPVTRHFVRRTAQLAACANRLERESWLLIGGTPGIGKTALGVQLARERARSEQDIFWFTFDPVEKNTLDALVHALAVFMAGRGDRKLWTYLASELTPMESTAAQPLSLTVKGNLIATSLVGHPFVLCFDDLHIAMNAPDIPQLFRTIHQQVAGRSGDLVPTVLLIGREFPPALSTIPRVTLEGLEYVETESLAASSGTFVPEHILHKVWEVTQGNPQLLELSLAAVADKAGDFVAIDAFVNDFAKQPVVRDYLMANLYAAMPNDERRTLDTLSVFPSYVPTSIVESILVAQGVAATPRLQALVDKNVVGEDAAGRVHCHSLIGEYSYRALGRSERRRAHRYAAREFRREHRYLEAAYHNRQAGQINRAVRLLTANARSLIADGQSGSLLAQLSRFDLETVPQWQRSAVHRARGDAYRMRGNYQAALEAYEAALLEVPDDRTRAAVLAELGLVDYRRWALSSAIERLSESKVIANRAGDGRTSANASTYLGWSLYRQALVYAGQEQGGRPLRELGPARAEFTIALEAGLRLRDRELAAKAMFGLGTIETEAGHLDAARELLEDSRGLFERTGERELAARVLTDLARVHGLLGDRATQRDLLEASVAQHEAIGNVDGLRAAYNNLGNLHLRYLDEPGPALTWYERLAALCRDTEHWPLLIIACVGLADTCLALDAASQAQVHADEARRLAAGLSRDYDTQYLGASLRVSGDVLLALGKRDEAEAALAESVEILSTGSEIARDELALAQRSLARAREDPHVYGTRP